jgi:hypothetical protein
MRIELGKPGEFDRPKTPEEIIDELEQRMGPKGRIIFETFVREINRLQAEQQSEEQERQQEPGAAGNCSPREGALCGAS